ncbi:MAG TPA: molybdopterin-dependent oxidoreductase [Microthrixaceae bacterium]|nr:molybdopterin-dependent oxidoreductase [Microthrixaceae bacterium]
MDTLEPHPTSEQESQASESTATLPTESHPWLVATVTAVLTVASALATGGLASVVLEVSGPLAAVGSRVIDHAPTAVREWAIDVFGTADKAALQVGTVVILLGLGTVVARFASRHRALVVIAPAVLAAVGVVSARSSTEGAGASIPAVVAGLTAAVVLGWLTSPTRGAMTAEPFDRRTFLVRAAVVSAGAAGVAATGAVIGGERDREIATTARQLRLPAPTDTVPPVPDTASIGHGVEPFLTPNEDFYRIDTALVPPRVDLDSWRLTIGGMVDHRLELDFESLLDRGVVERVVTLACVSNEIGGPYVGNAKWLGVPLASLLEEAGVDPAATQVASRSVDGWTCGFPTEVALDGRDALVAVGMNGEPLPVAHGFPVRLVVPGLYGYVSATKWLSEIELTTFEDFEGYWIPRGWAVEAPVKTASRIDVPRRNESVPAGPVAIAGVAWAQHRGIAKVEVRVDDGDWEEAELATDVSVDAWRQWVHVWDASPGEHRLAVRATDGTGETQPERRTRPIPDGAQGWHYIDVQVGD